MHESSARIWQLHSQTPKSAVMKTVLIILGLVGSSFVFGQEESRVEKKYERYENGELIEDKYYLEENGRAIAGEDFEMPELDEMQAKMAVRQAEMEQRMQKMQQEANERMDKARLDMDKRMNEMQQRMNQMQREMDLKMQEHQQMQAPQLESPKQNSAPKRLGTTYQT